MKHKHKYKVHIIHSTFHSDLLNFLYKHLAEKNRVKVEIAYNVCRNNK